MFQQGQSAPISGILLAMGSSWLSRQDLVLKCLVLSLLCCQSLRICPRPVSRGRERLVLGFLKPSCLLSGLRIKVGWRKWKIGKRPACERLQAGRGSELIYTNLISDSFIANLDFLGRDLVMGQSVYYAL